MNARMLCHWKKSFNSIQKFALVYGLPRRVLFLVMIIFVIFALTGCTTYSSKFICSEAKGLNCEMLHSVDQKITTGEIDRFYICRSRKCLKGKL
jgi:hypothetical protein